MIEAPILAYLIETTNGRMKFDGPDRVLEHGVEADYFEHALHGLPACVQITARARVNQPESRARGKEGGKWCEHCLRPPCISET